MMGRRKRDQNRGEKWLLHMAAVNLPVGIVRDQWRGLVESKSTTRDE